MLRSSWLNEYSLWAFNSWEGHFKRNLLRGLTFQRRYVIISVCHWGWRLSTEKEDTEEIPRDVCPKQQTCR